MLKFNCHCGRSLPRTAIRGPAIQKKYVEGKILLHLYLDYQEKTIRISGCPASAGHDRLFVIWDL